MEHDGCFYTKQPKDVYSKMMLTGPGWRRRDHAEWYILTGQYLLDKHFGDFHKISLLHQNAHVI